MHDKRSLIDSVTPLAILKAVTPEAREAINSSCLGQETIGIWNFPFRIGRESRAQIVDGQLVVSERHRRGQDSMPTNDLYLHDNGKETHISREHLSLKQVDGHYRLTDRESACGTAIGSVLVGGEEHGGEYLLNDGDTIRIGGSGSPFLYEFITLT